MQRSSLLGEVVEPIAANPTTLPLGSAVAGLAGVMAIVSAAFYLTWPLPEDNGLHFAGVHQALTVTAQPGAPAVSS